MQTTHIYTTHKTSIFDVQLRHIKPFAVLKKSAAISLRTALLVAFIIMLFTVITSNTDLLGIRSYTVLSGSMEPTISTGSIIYTWKNLGYNRGDVVTYKTSGETLVTHRIVDVKNNGEVLYLTKGDANTAPDATFITADKIIGKTYFSLPFIGKLSGMLKTPQGLLLVVFLPTVLIVLYELWNIKKEVEKSVERKLLAKLREQGGAHTHSHIWSESHS